MNTTESLNFFKSSYSSDRVNCVEVAHIPTDFHKSSYSADTGGNCVEAAELPCGAAIRDSKHPTAGHLPFSASEWAGFLSTALGK